MVVVDGAVRITENVLGPGRISIDELTVFRLDDQLDFVKMLQHRLTIRSGWDVQFPFTWSKKMMMSNPN